MRRVKASELTLSAGVRAAVGRVLAPIEAWEAIESPDIYLESRTGVYIRGLELLLEKAVDEGDRAEVRGLLLDLLRMTKVGRAKADLTLAGLNKLRPESDLHGVDSDQLRELLGRVKKEG